MDRLGGGTLKFVKTIILFLLCTILTACSYDYTTAEERGDIVDLHGKITNEERLDEFIMKIEANKKDKIRITRYTIEGDPLFHDFSYDGKKINYKYDNSKDKYGSSDVRSTKCDSFIKNETNLIKEFLLEGCSGKNAEIGEHFRFEISSEVSKAMQENQKIVINKRIGTANQYEKSKEINNAQVEMFLEILIRAEWENAKVLMDSSPDYQINDEYGIWLTQSDRLEMINFVENKYTILSKETSAVLYELITDQKIDNSYH